MCQLPPTGAQTGVGGQCGSCCGREGRHLRGMEEVPLSWAEAAGRLPGVGSWYMQKQGVTARLGAKAKEE